jgi:hypothetical protein
VNRSIVQEDTRVSNKELVYKKNYDSYQLLTRRHGKIDRNKNHGFEDDIPLCQTFSV